MEGKGGSGGEDNKYKRCSTPEGFAVFDVPHIPLMVRSRCGCLFFPRI